MDSFRAGDTFLIDDPGSGGRKEHLRIVLCAPSGSPPTVFTVPLNTRTPVSDCTVVLHPGEHPLIRRESVIRYDLLVEMDIGNLELLERMNQLRTITTFERREPVSDELLSRIIEGATRSDMTPKKMLKALRSRGVA